MGFAANSHTQFFCFSDCQDLNKFPSGSSVAVLTPSCAVVGHIRLWVPHPCSYSNPAWMGP